MLTKEELPACPVATTLQLIGSKWKILIIRNLMSRPWRFNELKRDLEGISQKVLTDSLRSMEEDGIITRTVYAEVPPRVEYALSDLGENPCAPSSRQWQNGAPPTRRPFYGNKPPIFLYTKKEHSHISTEMLLLEYYILSTNLIRKHMA